MAWYDTTQGARYRYGSDEANANAWEIYTYFRGLSTPWAVESIAALCGNIQLESIMNPFIRSTTESGAFGLVQWRTHKSDMIAWANNQGLRPTSGPAQVAYIEQERLGIDDQWLNRYNGTTFTQFATNSKGYSVSELSYCWWVSYERSAEYQEDRTRWSEGYYELFTGSEPPGPEPETIPTWLLFKLMRRGKRHVRRTIYI